MEGRPGFPLLLIAGGGLNSVIAGLPRSPFNPIDEFKDKYTLVYPDLAQRRCRPVLRPLEINRP